MKVTWVTKSSNGYSSYLSNLKPGEPDAELFRAPAGYALVDEAAEFPMVVRFQQGREGRLKGGCSQDWLP